MQIKIYMYLKFYVFTKNMHVLNFCNVEIQPTRNILATVLTGCLTVSNLAGMLLLEFCSISNGDKVSAGIYSETVRIWTIFSQELLNERCYKEFSKAFAMKVFIVVQELLREMSYEERSER